MSIWDDLDEVEVDQSLISNKYLDNEQEGLNFLANLLSSDSQENELDKKFLMFENIVNNDFLDFSNQFALKNEAQMFNKFIQTKDNIEEFIKFPFVTGKNIIAIGGGFSSGKSQFINSILGEGEVLPTDTRPTTSIPTYIAKGNHKKMHSFNMFGNKTNLDKEGVLAISHAFNEKYNLSFTRILKNLLVESLSFEYKNIAFLDTPGYTKADFHKRQDNTDESVAKEHLKSCDYLLWLIDIEKGTIPKQDIDFIKSLDIVNPIYVMFTKADKKIQSDIEKIIDVTKDNLNKAFIKYYGISAYSSIYNEEYAYEGICIRKFLDNVNKNKKERRVVDEVKEIFKAYKDYNDESIRTFKSELEFFNKLSLESDEIYNKVKDKIQDCKNNIIDRNSKKNIISSFEKKVMNIINEIFDLIAKNMKYGQEIELYRDGQQTDEIVVELGWANKKNKNTDIDISAFLLDGNEKVSCDEDFIFYNNTNSLNNEVRYYNDDDRLTNLNIRKMDIELKNIKDSIKKIKFSANIYTFKDEIDESFSNVKDAYISIKDRNTNKELIKFNIEDGYENDKTLVFGDLIKDSQGWNFYAIGEGFDTGLENLCQLHGLEVE